MLFSAEEVSGDAHFSFRHNLVSAHTAESNNTRSCDHGITVLHWPADCHY